MKKLIVPTSILAIALCIATCKKESDENPYPQVAAPTCSDGIQNQGETGVDCGGPCSACPTNVCTGNGSNQYLPLATGNKWIYDYNYYVSWADRDTCTIEGTETLGGKTYYRVRFMTGQPGGSPQYFDFRYDAATGNTYQYSGSSEYIFIPASPTVGQILANGGNFTYSANQARRVISVAASVSTGTCTYTNCLQIERYNASTSYHYGYDYYVKGVGFVKEDTDLKLKSIQLY